MAKLRFSIKAADLRAKIFDGRHEQARNEAQALLREGYAHRDFLDLVADMLEPQDRGKGQPSRPPARWLDIGERFQEEMDNGLTPNRARAKLAAEFNTSESTVRRAVEIYEAAQDEAGNVR